MAAPPIPKLPVEAPGDGDPFVEPDEHQTSHTRRLGSNAQLEIELDTEPRGPGDARRPSPTPLPATSPYLPGDLIASKYKLTRIIGRGGMGAVWQAHNVPLDIDVAVKLIRRDRTAPEAAERLLTEARAAARLVHPSIVRVFDFGESDRGDPFIVMELIRGESLSAILRRKKRLTPAVAVQTLLPVFAALASAHGKGIVHRDLKPDNILVGTDENNVLVPKIVDFGIAKLMSPDVDRQVTMAGEVLGSPDYMSPEQARGAVTVGEATDIWALSVVLYELCTGKRPFDGPNYNSLIAAILTNDPTPITALNAGDTELAQIINRGLAKDIAARWAKVRDFGVALAQWAVDRGIEDDVAGNPIGKQWLAGEKRRVLTVMPDDMPAPPPAGAPAAPVQPGDGPVTISRRAAQRGARSRAAMWISLGVVATGLLATAFLARSRFAQMLGGPASAAPSIESAAPPAASASAPPPASAAPGESAAAPAASTAEAAAASAPPVASAHAPLRGTLRKNRAPPAPKNIKF